MATLVVQYLVFVVAQILHEIGGSLLVKTVTLRWLKP